MLLGKEEVDADFLENTAKYEIFPTPENLSTKVQKCESHFASVI